MAVLIEAKRGKKDGTAYLPYEWLTRQGIPVEVVDREWLRLHWKKIERSHLENQRLVAFQNLRQAVDGKSSNLDKAAAVAVTLSEPCQKFMDEIAAEYAAGGFHSLTPSSVWRPPSQGQIEAASESMFSLRSKPRAILAAEMTRGLSRVKVCQWLNLTERRQFGLFCPDMLSAIYAVAAEGFGIAVCLRCGELFLRERVDKQFCSLRCKNTYLTANRRRREKNRPSKRGQRAA